MPYGYPPLYLSASAGQQKVLAGAMKGVKKTKVPAFTPQKKQKAAAKAAAAAQMQPRSKAGLVAQRNNAAANAKAMVRTQAQVLYTVCSLACLSIFNGLQMVAC